MLRIGTIALSALFFSAPAIACMSVGDRARDPDGTPAVVVDAQCGPGAAYAYVLRYDDGSERRFDDFPSPERMVENAAPWWDEKAASCLREGHAVTTPEGKPGTVATAQCEAYYEEYTVMLDDGSTAHYVSTEVNRVSLPEPR